MQESESKSCMELLDELINTVDRTMIVLEELEGLVGLLSSTASEGKPLSKGTAYRVYVTVVELTDMLRRVRNLAYTASEACKR